MMIAQPRSLSLYIDKKGKCCFRLWLDGLKDIKGRAAVLGRINRLRWGNFGDCKRFGDITELRVSFGPGYRVYLGQDGPMMVVLLIGGDKSTQSRDFTRAQEAWDDYQKRKTEALAAF